MSYFSSTLSKQELISLLNGETIDIKKYMNGGEVQDQCSISLDLESKDFYEKLINVCVLKIFDKEGVSKLEEIFKGYLEKIQK